MTNFYFEADWTNPNKPKLIISSDSDNDTKKLFKNFKHFSTGSLFSDTISYNEQTHQMIFAASRDVGNPGIYEDRYGSIAVDFLSVALRNIFVLHFPELKNAGLAMEDHNVFYFQKTTQDSSYTPRFNGKPAQTIMTSPLSKKGEDKKIATFTLVPFTVNEFNQAKKVQSEPALKATIQAFAINKKLAFQHADYLVRQADRLDRAIKLPSDSFVVRNNETDSCTIL